MSQRRRRHTPEQIIRKLREGEKLLGQGAELPEVLKHLEITEATWYRWRNQFGGLKANEAKRLNDLKREKATLKRWPTRSWRRPHSGRFPGETSEPGMAAGGRAPPDADDEGE